jgi:hypothetical protein
VTITQAPPSDAVVLLIGVAALGAVTVDVSWQIVRHFTVMAHEGAHALTGFLLLRSFNGIELNRDATGGTDIRPAGGLGGVLIGLSGYVGPSGFGLVAAKLIELSYATAVLWVVLFLLAVLLIGLRLSFGIITVLAAGLIVYGVGRYSPMPVQVGAAYAIAWLLLLSGVRRVLEVGTGSDDGDRLRGLTHLPRVLWFVLWLGVTLAAAFEGARLLLVRA